ncbi:sugar phosphate nucleotidyltransferase [Methylacidiphilum caldifontis]|uniref:Nucleoside-diphosphate-sugar pyrophosphorylase n=1 Tax=Methylacidiphilum caldifontis TaxID=2795386 RepID=A0A4Y8PH96_9BACT|nr:sugar phosphate nucleotidyltransferase [Methylacidiphilum caldifontis]QSR88948.1 NTP transferase domain-containing protein [Methylacidiphilum caldifontis]TFE71808.1 nucleoside-diphosphate-sugar pyrophosphorylase [Methylacidiphilum caldifontis]
MKAIILAAGKGSRMKELTVQLPKPMLEVKGRPILEWIIKGLKQEAQVEDFCIVVGYRAEKIIDYFKEGQSLGVKIEYRFQHNQDGTGKAPLVAKSFIHNEPFFLSYGDILLEDPKQYKQMVIAYKGDGLVGLTRGDDLSKGGAVLMDAQGHITEIIEKPQNPGMLKGAYYNAGIYILSPKIFDYMESLSLSPRGEYEFTDALRLLSQKGELFGFILSGNCVDVRDPQILSMLNS